MHFMKTCESLRTFLLMATFFFGILKTVDTFQITCCLDFRTYFLLFSTFWSFSIHVFAAFVHLSPASSQSRWTHVKNVRAAETNRVTYRIKFVPYPSAVLLSATEAATNKRRRKQPDFCSLVKVDSCFKIILSACMHACMKAV